ncbi:hypothetical protein OIE62_07750 [Streptomyces scopuliridis]|uniref:Uncharacterized protein n=1 Tax=Streptomyces scopuliridis TaxID=452529 RepID=A0ACD4ZTJ1_9ACTN|nr:hypothetical protein [Streptomyces scopuliridis]WSC01540.1 hypothetical protein OG835_34070 [Streptomyces scopuliridis]WSC04922.1 hypothetical protein OIE62_07750 [Streptomyces scopuliridis]
MSQEPLLTTAADLTEQITHLRHLANDFKALHSEVRDLTVTPGTEALRHLTPTTVPAAGPSATTAAKGARQ